MLIKNKSYVMISCVQENQLQEYRLKRFLWSKLLFLQNFQRSSNEIVLYIKPICKAQVNLLVQDLLFEIHMLALYQLYQVDKTSAILQ